MPVLKCSNGKYRIGSGECVYRSRESAERAYKGYLGSKYAESHAPKNAIQEGVILADRDRTTKHTQQTKK
jgi:hypothetical protein